MQQNNFFESETDNKLLESRAGWALYLLIPCVILVSILTAPNLFSPPHAGLDNSWKIGLNLALIKKLQFGKDIVFTFGPLGFLYRPVLCNVGLWTISCAFGILVHLTLVSLIITVLLRHASAIAVIFSTCSLIWILPNLTADYELLLIANFLLYSVLIAQPRSQKSWPVLIAIGVLFATASLIKFNAFAVSWAGMCVAGMIFIYRRDLAGICVLVTAYAMSLIGLWAVAAQQISNIGFYMIRSMEISFGYSQAMIKHDKPLPIALAAVSLIIFIILSTYSAIFKKYGLLTFVAVMFAFVFTSFKHGFIRSDQGHSYFYFAVIFFVLGWILIGHKQDLSKFLNRLTFFVCCAIIIFFATRDLQLIQRMQSNLSAYTLLPKSTAYKQQIFDKYKLEMKNECGLSNSVIDSAGRKKIDIFPWEISLAYACDLNWAPRPVFQSYSAYTHKLDYLNADYYKRSAPEVLFYELKNIDNKYPIFDEPETFQVILENYRPDFNDGRFLILAKKKEEQSFQKHLISSSDNKMGWLIQVPASSGYLFASVNIEYNILGKIVNALFRGDGIMVFLSTANRTFTHRFIPATSSGGIFLSSYVRNNDDLSNVFAEKFSQPIKAIKFVPDRKWFYKDKIHVEFYELNPARKAAVGVEPTK